MDSKEKRLLSLLEEFYNEDPKLSTVFESIRIFRDYKDSVKKFFFNIGDKVRFKIKKKGIGEVEGIIIKKNTKRVQVETSYNGIWNVPPSYLTKIWIK